MNRSMLTVPEAAEVLRVSPNHLYNLCAQGEIAHRRLGRRVLIPKVVVDDLCGLTPAAPDASRGSAAAVEAPGTGAAGPADRHVVSVATSAPARGLVRPAAPNTNRTPLAATSGVRDNAG